MINSQKDEILHYKNRQKKTALKTRIRWGWVNLNYTVRILFFNLTPVWLSSGTNLVGSPEPHWV